MKYAGTYTPPTLTVDSVVFQLENDSLSVLLIQRAHEPFKGAWALPGGYNAQGETTREAMERILVLKAGVSANQLDLIEQLYTFDTVARDPRGHAVSITYMALGKTIEPSLSSTTQHPRFFPISALPELAYDHKEIITYAHKRLESKVTYTNAVFALLPAKFTLTMLQHAYEAIFCRELDKRNFRKKFLSFDLIKPTDEYLREGAHRPARLYTFNKHSLEFLTRSFD